MAKKSSSSMASQLSVRKLWSFLTSEHHLQELLSVSYRPHLAPIRIGMACLLISVVFHSGPICVLSSHYQLAICIITALSLVVICLAFYYRVRPSPCYLVDFCCVKGDDNSFASVQNFLDFFMTRGSVRQSNVQFQFKVYLRSGIGEEAYAPARLIEKGEDVSMEDARVETQDLISRAAKSLLQKTGIDSKEVDIVIVNSSLFNPAPSFTAYLVNVLSMRCNVKSFNLAGMGCSAGLIAIDLAKDLLKVHRNSYALVVSTENITKNMYFGNDRSMMISNCLFRCGGSAVLLTNKPESRRGAKMQLLHCLRTNIGADQKAYECVQHMEDDEGKLGVCLKVSLLEVAGNALRANITKLAPSILPLSELLKVVVSLVKKNALNMSVKPYEPNFKKAIDHFCIHPGGKAVIDSIGKGLNLSDYDIEPGKMALNRFGNTSSSGIWYALAYCEAKGRLKKGSKVWQIALGSGFKCNSGVWRVLRDLDPEESLGCNPWLSCIHKYPAASMMEGQIAAVVKAVGGSIASKSTEPNTLAATTEPCKEEVKRATVTAMG